jgi:peroxiredoxin
LSPAKAGIKDVRGQDLTHGFIPRTTYVINKEGKIVAVFSSQTDHISPADHVSKALAIVQTL